MRIIRVFPRRTRATPDDLFAVTRSPSFFDFADEVHVSVTFSWDKPRAEKLAEEWSRVAPVKIGGPAYEQAGELYPNEFIAGRYIKQGYTFTSRGCPRRCFFCGVWKKRPKPITIPDFPDGWNVLDDNLLACPRPHVESVFEMLRRQDRRVEFTGGLEALSLKDYQVDLLASLTPRPNCFFAYDPGDEFETLADAARRLLAAGFTVQSHRLRCYVLIGHEGDTIAKAEERLARITSVGFTPMAMLYRPAQEDTYQDWNWRKLQRHWARPAIIHAREAA